MKCQPMNERDTFTRFSFVKFVDNCTLTIVFRVVFSSNSSGDIRWLKHYRFRTKNLLGKYEDGCAEKGV